MCTGAEIALIAGSTALSGAGSMIQSREAEKNASRVKAARDAELARTLQKNKVLSDEATSYFNDRLSRTDKTSQDTAMAKNEEALAQDYTAAASSVPTADVPLTGSAPDVVKTEIGKRLSDALDKGKTQAKSLAKLGSYTQTNLNNSIDNMRTGQKIAIPGGFAQSNMGFLPYLQDEAELNATRPSSGIGALLSGAGSLGGMAAGSGYFTRGK